MRLYKLAFGMVPRRISRGCGYLLDYTGMDYWSSPRCVFCACTQRANCAGCYITVYRSIGCYNNIYAASIYSIIVKLKLASQWFMSCCAVDILKEPVVSPIDRKSIEARTIYSGTNFPLAHAIYRLLILFSFTCTFKTIRNTLTKFTLLIARLFS